MQKIVIKSQTMDYSGLLVLLCFVLGCSVCLCSETRGIMQPRIAQNSIWLPWFCFCCYNILSNTKEEDRVQWADSPKSPSVILGSQGKGTGYSGDRVQWTGNPKSLSVISGSQGKETGYSELTPPSHHPSPGEVKAEAPSGSHITSIHSQQQRETKAAMLSTCSVFYPSLLLQDPGTQTREWCCPHILGPPPSINNQDRHPTDMPTGQSGLDNL